MINKPTYLGVIGQGSHTAWTCLDPKGLPKVVHDLAGIGILNKE